MERSLLIESLAHLDFLALTPKTTSLQKDPDEHICDGLTELAAHLNGVYTVSEIRECLWKEFCGNDYKWTRWNFRELFVHGSTEMKSLDPAIATAVQERVKEMLHLSIYEPRKTRHGSSFPRAASTAGSRRSATPARKCTTTVRKVTKRVRQKSTTPARKHSRKHPLRIETLSKSDTDQLPARTSSIEIGESPSRTVSASPPVQQYAIAARPLTSACNERRCTATQTDAPADDASVVDARNETINVTSFIEMEDYTSLYLRDDLVSCQKRCKAMEQERDCLVKEQRQLRSLDEELNGKSAKLLKVLQKTTAQNTWLKEKLHDQKEALDPYFKSGNMYRPYSNDQKIMANFKNMKEELIAIRMFQGTYEPHIGRILGVSEDLDLLLSTLGIHHQSKTEGRHGNVTPVSLVELVRALTAAAIHHWVFMSKFLCHAMTVTPLLQKYHDCLDTWFTAEILCNLDTAVHQYLVGEDSFTNTTIPRMSSTLTKRLLVALQPLLEQRSDNPSIKNLTTYLNCVMISALKIRSLSLVGTESFESILPPIGSSLEEVEMEIEQPRRSADIVRLPLCPGLRAYPKDKSMVQYDGFGSGEHDRRKAKYVVKALVLT